MPSFRPTTLAFAAGLCVAMAPLTSAATRAPAAPATQAAPTAAVPQALQARVPGLLRNYLKLRGQTPNDEPADDPETARPDPTGLAIVLPEALQTVDQALASAPTVMLGALQAAREGYAAAEKALHAAGDGSSPRFMVGVLQEVGDGQAGLDQALDIAASVDPDRILIGLLLPAVQKVREAAARTSQDLIDLAAAAGASEDRLDGARAAQRTGDALFEAGDYGGSAQQYAQGFGIAADTVVFDMDRFEDNLRSVFDANTVGWSYALSQGGVLARSGTAGVARTGADQPQTVQSASKKMHVASVSKTLTSIVMLRRLSDLGIDVESPIGPWLPALWPRPAEVNSITFRQLLNHRSGFGQNELGGNDWAGLQTMVAQPVPFMGSFDYFNANFGLLRVMVAKTLGVDPTLIPLPLDAGALATSAFLANAVSLYDGIGVPFSCEPQGTNPTVQYEFPDTGNPGYVEPSRSLVCGGYGVQISAVNLARTMAYLRYTQDLLPTPRFQEMKSKFLGFMNPANGYGFAQGSFGVYHTHGGDWDHTGSRNGGLDSCVMMFPINVEAAVLINSSRKELGVGYPNGGYQCSVLKWAFESAWVAQ